MPYKHQTRTYRIVKGERFECFCDVLDEEHRVFLELVRSSAAPYRVYKHPDGFERVFTRPADVLHFATLFDKAIETARGL